MTINEILKALKKINDDAPVFVADTLSVELTGEVMSWRGDYDCLALGYCLYGDSKEFITVGKLKSILQNSLGETFMGYKGGEFVMEKNTPVYLDNYGFATGHYIARVSAFNNVCYLEIEKEQEHIPYKFNI